MFTDKDVVFSFSRNEALANGDLVDIPKAWLEEAGIKYPAVISIGLQSLLIPTEREVGNGQSLEGRLWDMLIGFRVLAKNNLESYLRFPLRLETEGGPRSEEIVIICGPDDYGGPCLTFMTPSCGRRSPSARV